jgi:hypothetical protein
LQPEDIFINLVEVLPENWSLGHGVVQYAPVESRAQPVCSRMAILHREDAV